MVEGGGDNSFIEDGVSEDLDQEDLSLGNREVKEVDGDFIGRGVQDRGHVGMRRIMPEEHLISLPARVIWAVIGMLPHVLPIGGSVL